MTDPVQDPKSTAAARVRIAYEVRTADSTHSRELPFVIGVIGDFCAAGSRSKKWEERQIHAIDLGTLDAVMGTLRSRLQLELPADSTGSGFTAALDFHRLQDFEPERIVEQVDHLRRLRLSPSRTDHEALQGLLDSILHAPEFQRLEAAWRGLWRLASRLDKAEHVSIRLIDVSREQLLEDFRTASAIEDSVFSRKLYRDPYEIDRCDPFSLLVGDFTFTPAPDHMTLLAGIAAVARKCLAPFLAAAGPEMLNVEDFTWISGHRNIFRTRFQRGNPEQPVASDHVLPESPLWKNFRDSEDSRFAGLVVPRVLLRERYLSSSAAANGFVYNETQDNERCFLWGNAAFALAAGIAEGFERNGWFDSPLGGPNLTKGFPARVLKHDFSEHEVATSLEVRIMEGADKALSVHGFIPLVMGIHGESLAFWTPSCHRPKVFENPIATSEARMHNQLTYVLAGSRFMHGLKVLVRDAGEHSRARLGQLLQQWIMQYVCVNDQAPESERAQRPLRAAVVSLHETPGNPESVKMVAFLLPKFGRLNELKIELRLIAEIALPVSSIDPQ